MGDIRDGVIACKDENDIEYVEYAMLKRFHQRERDVTNICEHMPGSLGEVRRNGLELSPMIWKMLTW